MMTYVDHYRSPLGGITISSNGSEITGLWIYGQKYFGAGLPSFQALSASRSGTQSGRRSWSFRTES